MTQVIEPITPAAMSRFVNVRLSPGLNRIHNNATANPPDNSNPPVNVKGLRRLRFLKFTIGFILPHSAGGRRPTGVHPTAYRSPGTQPIEGVETNPVRRHISCGLTFYDPAVRAVSRTTNRVAPNFAGPLHGFDSAAAP
jgi:hypothetical protein